MLIAQISDLHISTFGEKTLGIAPMADNLKRCVEHINHLHNRPQLVLVTGDISNTGTKEELKHAKNILDQFKMPYYVIPGNHDNREAFVNVFGTTTCPSESDNIIQYSINHYDVRFIALDTSIPKKPGGEFTQKNYLWLEQQLQIEPQRPVILFMHHPPINFGIAETDIDGFEGNELLADILKKHDNIEALLCGHIHRSAHTRWHGSLVSTAPSIGMRLVLDFTMQQKSQYILDDPSYLLHYWTKDKNLISYDVSVNDTDFGHPFH